MGGVECGRKRREGYSTTQPGAPPSPGFVGRLHTFPFSAFRDGRESPVLLLLRRGSRHGAGLPLTK
jgi:hypothetical protein